MLIYEDFQNIDEKDHDKLWLWCLLWTEIILFLFEKVLADLILDQDDWIKYRKLMWSTKTELIILISNNIFKDAILLCHTFTISLIFSLLFIVKFTDRKKFKLEFQSELVIRDILLVPVEFSTLFWLKMMNLRRNVCVASQEHWS